MSTSSRLHFRRGAGLCLAAALLVAEASAQTRPRDPFVFRTVLKENTSTTQACTAANGCMNRLVAVLLAPQMTALYSTLTGTLYLTRNAVPQDGNLTYSHTQYGGRLQWPGTSGGTNLHRNVEDAPWTFLQAGSPLASRVVYRGFELSGTNQEIVTLKHDIVAGANVVSVHETPEYVAVGGNPGLRRTFVVSGLAAGQSLRLHLSGQVRPETWTSTVGGTLAGTSPVLLNITENGVTVITGSWQP